MNVPAFDLTAPAEGARLAARIGAITAPLKPEQRQVLAALLISYPGW